MNPENMLVPYEASKLPPGPWLVFAPHADDETFGMGGSLLRAAQSEIATHVVVMTDGAQGGNTPDLVTTRKREVEDATTRLGVTSLRLWEEPDRGLRVSEPLIDHVIRAIESSRPASVFFPAPLELHPDHRIAAQLVWQGLGRMAANGVQTPVAFAYEISVQSPINFLLDISAQAAIKRQVMDIYISQNSQIDYPGLVAALNNARALTLPRNVISAEGFFRYEPEALDSSLADVTAQSIARYFQ